MLPSAVVQPQTVELECLSIHFRYLFEYLGSFTGPNTSDILREKMAEWCAGDAFRDKTLPFRCKNLVVNVSGSLFEKHQLCYQLMSTFVDVTKGLKIDVFVLNIKIMNRWQLGKQNHIAAYEELLGNQFPHWTIIFSNLRRHDPWNDDLMVAGNAGNINIKQLLAGLLPAPAIPMHGDIMVAGKAGNIDIRQLFELYSGRSTDASTPKS